MKTEIYKMSALELSEAYKNKILSPVEATNSVLDRINDIDKKVNAYVFIDKELARTQAKESEIRWNKGIPKSKIDGVPSAIKDLLLTKDWPTLRGSKTVNKNIEWKDDAPVTSRLKESGAVLIGKTTTPEFGHKGTTQSPLTGITRNPWNLECTSGGSSGGSSSSVASGMGPLAIGTDGGGSVRIPCSFTGLFGIKPTFGKVPAWPLSPFGTIANIGPMTRTVHDGALLFSIISQPDWRDWHANTIINSNFIDNLADGIKGKKVAYCPDFGMSYVIAPYSIESDVATAAKNTANLLETLGAHVEQIEIKWPSDPKRAFHVLWTAGAAFLAQNFSNDEKELLDPKFKNFCEEGAELSLFERLEAEASRGLNGGMINELFQNYDLLVGPTMPTKAFKAEDQVPEGWGNDVFNWTPFTYPFNMTCHPAATVNCGFSDGLPIGFQIIARKDADLDTFVCAAAIEKALNLTDKWPSI